MKQKIILTLILSAAFYSAGNCASLDSAGVIKFVTGEVVIAGTAGVVKAVPNMKVYSGDVIKTDVKGYAGIIFEDDTVVSMGPLSEFALDDFQFSPAEKQLSFVVKMLKGTFSFLSGQIARLAPGKVKLMTPDATLGIRGTKLLVKVE